MDRLTQFEVILRNLGMPEDQIQEEVQWLTASSDAFSIPTKPDSDPKD